eukprot:389819-Pelagomonas_calceolata.AAC.1
MSAHWPSSKVAQVTSTYLINKPGWCRWKASIYILHRHERPLALQQSGAGYLAQPSYVNKPEVQVKSIHLHQQASAVQMKSINLTPSNI